MSFLKTLLILVVVSLCGIFATLAKNAQVDESSQPDRVMFEAMIAWPEVARQLDNQGNPIRAKGIKGREGFANFLKGLNISEAQALTEIMPGGHPKGVKGHLTLKPDDFRHLAFFRNAKKFLLYELDGINDRALEVIASNLPASVEEIMMEGLDDNGVGVRHFKGNTTLRAFNLYFDKEVTDVACEHLGRIPNLEAINLSGNPKLKGHGIKFLAQLRHLKALKLNDTGVDDDAFRFIGKLQTIESLSINGTAISGEALIYFLSDNKHVPGLRVLSFKNSRRVKVNLGEEEKEQLLALRPRLEMTF